MCRYSSMALLAALALCGCAHQPIAKGEPKPTVSQVERVQTEAASLIGTWTTAIPDEPKKVAQVVLGADEHWTFWPSGGPEHADLKKPNQAGTWFVRNGKVFLLVEQSES